MKTCRLICLLAALAAAVSLSSPTQAQVTNQHYASPTGTGTTCTASAPCSLFQAINSQLAGVISCIDGGFFSDKIATPFSLTIDCPGAVLTSSGGPVLTLEGASTQVVILRNLTFEGAGQNGAPFIQVTGGTTLIIENCKFQNIRINNAIAIQYLPSQPAAQLIIRDSAFIENGIVPEIGGALQVAPAAGGSASVKLERVSFDFNITSMVLNGSVDATMINSTVSASRSNGILVGSGAKLDVFDSTLADNVGSAISVSAGGTVRLSNSNIKSNQVGISNSGGQALTYSNNRIFGNGSTAALTPVQGGQ